MTAFKNGAGREAGRMVQFRPYADPEDVGKGELYVGQLNTKSIIWRSDTDFTVYVHDGFTPGGHPIEGGGGGPGADTNVAGRNGVLVTEPTADNFMVEADLYTSQPNALMTRAQASRNRLFVRPVAARDASVTVNTTADQQQVRAEISSDSGNQLRLEDDGLYVPPPPAPPAQATVAGSNTGVTVEQPTAGNYTVGARRSADANNQLEIRSNGLYVPPGEGGGGEAVPLQQGDINFDIEATGGEITMPNVPRAFISAPANTTYMRLSEWDAPNPAELYLWVYEHGQPWQLRWVSGVTVNGVPGPATLDVPRGGGLKLFKHEEGEFESVPYFPEGSGGGGGSEYTAGDGLELDGNQFELQLMQFNGQMLRVDPDDGLYMLNLQTIYNSNIAYTLVGQRANGHVHFDHASATVGVTVPHDSGLTNYPVGAMTLLTHATASFIVSGETGVTINGQTSTMWRVQPAPGGAVLLRLATNNWLLLGDVEAET